MCGIFGWIPSNKYKATDTKPIVDKIFKAMAHRGPDDKGYAVLGNSTFDALIAQVRLSIIDLTPSGHQPLFSEDGRYAIVYNGEVYNYVELREELKAEGVTFTTPNDTEVVMKAIVHWGKDALLRFTGMFAFAMYDKEKDKLLCARDFFGIKPFYYHAGDMGFCFASELPSLLEFPDVPRKLRTEGAYKYLCYGYYDIGGNIMLKDIYSLPPAHYVEIDVNNPEKAVPVRYWKPNLSKRSALSFEEAAKKLRQMFLDSVKLHLRSDVPLGVALSGGVDSSSVACAMRYLEPDVDLHTFSFIAKNSAVSEELWADIVARHIDAIRHIVEVDSKDLIKDLDSMIRAQGEPFGSTSVYAQYRLFKLAKDSGITVSLDGQGADELLAGYNGYSGERIASLILQFKFLSAYKFLKAASGWPGRSLKKNAVLAIIQFLPNFMFPLVQKAAGRTPEPKWLDVKSLKKAGCIISYHFTDCKNLLYPTNHKVIQMLSYQLTWDGIPALLRHGDRNAMAHSIESRVPFLTKEIAEFCLSLPEEYLIDMNGRTKSVFREAMRGIVPDEILDRKDKIGFATPEEDWLNSISSWVDETLENAGDIPYLKMDEVRKEWQEIKEKRAHFDWRVWRWINYIRWIKMFDIEK